VDDAFVDLAASMRQTRLKAAVISGDGTKFRLPLVVTNLGNVALEPQAVSVELFARPVGTEGEADAVVSTQELELKRLLPGGRQAVRLTAVLPMGLPTDEYVLGARLGPADELNDPDAGNDAATTPAGKPTRASEGFVDLVGEFASLRAADVLFAGHEEPVSARLEVRNAGNLPVKGPWHVDLIARPIEAEDETQDVTLTRLDGSSPLRPGGMRSVAARVTLPDALEPGEYQVFAHVDAMEQVAERNEGNAARFGGTLTLVRPGIDLVTDLNATSLPSTMAADALVDFPVSVTIHNRGNTPTPRGLTADVEIFSKLIEHGFHAQVFLGPKRALLDTLTGVDIGGLAIGASRTIEATVGLQTGVYRGEWSIETVIDPANHVEELDETNNAASTVRVLEATQSYAFSTRDQSMWGPGSNVFDTGLQSKEFSLDADLILPGLNIGLANAEVYAAAEGSVGLDFRARFDGGSVDVDYSSSAALEIINNGTRTGNGKDNFTFWTRPLEAQPTGTLVTRAPRIDIESNLYLDLIARIGSRGGVVGRSFDDSLTLLDLHETFNLLTLTNEEIRILGITLEDADPGLGLGYEIDIPYEVPPGTPAPKVVPEGAKKSPRKPHSKPKDALSVSASMGDLTLYLPSLEMETTEYEPIGNRILAVGATDLVRLDIDLDFLATALGAPALGVKVEIADLVEIAADILDLDFGGVVSARQDFAFTGRPMMTVSFSEPVDIKSYGTNVVIESGVTEYTAPVGQPFDFEADATAESLEITTEYHLDNTLRHLVDVLLAPQLEIDVLKFEAEFLGVELAKSTLYNDSIRGPALTLGTAFNESFTVGGFEAVEGDTYHMDLTDRSTVITVTGLPPGTGPIEG
jgi:hypothetical protein